MSDSSSPEGRAWQPIGTAPIKPFRQEAWYMAHSDYLLGWNGYGCQIISYHYTRTGKGKWKSGGRETRVTHWMQLPEGPK